MTNRNAWKFAGEGVRSTPGLLILSASALVLSACGSAVEGARQASVTPESFGSPSVTVAGDQFPDAGLNGETPTALDRTSTVSLDVDTASYSYARRSILGENRLPPPQAIRPEEWINYFDYPGYPSPSPGTALRAAAWVYQAPWRPDRTVIHIGVAAPDAGTVVSGPQNLVVLADVSGSMGGRDSVGLAADVIRGLARHVSPRDQVAIVTFNGEPRTLLAPTSGASGAALENAARSLRSGGSTAGAYGIDHAYNLARRSARPGDTNRVILITDGVFTSGSRTPEQLVDFIADRRRSGVNLSVLGVSRGGLDDASLQALAQAGNGEAAYLDDAIEAERVLSRLMAAGTPVARDARIDVEFNPAIVRSWRLVGYETREMSREQFFDPATDAAEVRPGQTATFIYEVALQSPYYAGGGDGPYRYPGTAGTGGNGSVGFVQPYRDRPDIDYGNGLSGAGWGELAFARLRYIDTASGRLVEQRTPVTGSPQTQLARMPIDIRFAAAVAMAAQAARGDTENPVETAQYAEFYGRGSVGSDTTGERTEFLRIADRIARQTPYQ